MPRRPRIHLAHGFYHVTLRGNHQRDLFVVDGDRSVLNGIVARVIEKHGVRVHAYCWMTNHLHMLIQAGTDPLAEPMRRIAAEFARTMQSRMQTTGHFFERRYHAVLVDADSYLLELTRYIHLNPVRAGLVESPAQYPWSSHHAYVGKRAENWVTTDFVLGMFNADRARAVSAYCAFLACEQPEEWIPPEDVAPPAMRDTSRAQFASVGNTAPGLANLIAEACRRFEVNPEHLASPLRDPYLTKVRAWIAHQAKVKHVATLASVARQLGRDESTLRQAIRDYPNETE
jgi:REP element-mobilizing transposase RayT